MLFSTFLAFALQHFVFVAGIHINNKDGSVPPLMDYDYIIVGAGIGGLVLASRLSEDPNVSVLLLEAGNLDDRSQRISEPGYVGFNPLPQYDWHLETAPQEFLDGSTRTYGQGKVVGGSTVLNGLCWTRGSRANFDAWEALGNDGWGWDGILPYFIKSENYSTNLNQAQQDAFDVHPQTCNHGDSGPVQLSFSHYYYNQSRNFLESVQQLGIPLVDELGDGVATGATIIPSSISADGQARSDARMAYWDPIAARENLHLATGCTVTRILRSDVAYPNSTWTSGGGTQISGVEYATTNSAGRLRVHCVREVILAAGAIFSPVLLQISGFGDERLLRNLSIETVVNLPGVGGNFQDHPMVQPVYNYTSPSIVTQQEYINDGSLSQLAEEEYAYNRTGPFTSPMVNTVAFPALSWVMNSSNIQAHATKAFDNATDSLPDSYEETLLAGYAEQTELLYSHMASNGSAAFELMGTSWGQLAISNMQPWSRGIVQAVSSSIFDAHIVNPRYCSAPVDCDIIALGLQFNARLIQTPPQQVLVPVSPPWLPQDMRNMTALGEAIRGAIVTEFHPSGTTAMLPLNKGGVVDTSLRVYGTRNLRVVDAGIMPLIPGGHIQAAVYAVAEKAADIIKSENAGVNATWPMPHGSPPVPFTTGAIQTGVHRLH